MFINFICPNCNKKYKIELTTANKEIARLEIELAKYRDTYKSRSKPRSNDSDLFDKLFGG